MSDSEGSLGSIRGSEKSGTREEIIASLPNQKNTSGDKLEEFEKLLQAMLPSRSSSQEADETEENEAERKIGRFYRKENNP